MKRLDGFQEPDCYRGGVVAIGNFDGVHRGHQRMIATLVERARTKNAPAVVLTFDPHPIELLRPATAPPRLTTIARRVERLGQLGVDCAIVYPTDMTLLNLSPLEFFEQIVRGELDARGLVEGQNFYFGHDRTGDIRTLERLCAEAGLTLDVVAPVEIEGRVVSSSTIRQCIASGDVARAALLLGQPYRISGMVDHGVKRGRDLGYPTANLTHIETMLPQDGVYAGCGHIASGTFPAAINLGSNPTFGENARKVEVHLLDFHRDLYGQTLDLEFLSRLRDIRTFAGGDELRRQLELDLAATRAVAKSSPSR